jgi:hypothetical protein
MDNDFNRDFDRNRLYDAPRDDSSLAWLGGLFAFMLIIGGLFYAFSGPSGDRVTATNTSPPMTQPATPPAAPATPAR